MRSLRACGDEIIQGGGSSEELGQGKTTAGRQRGATIISYMSFVATQNEEKRQNSKKRKEKKATRRGQAAGQLHDLCRREWHSTTQRQPKNDYALVGRCAPIHQSRTTVCIPSVGACPTGEGTQAGGGGRIVI